MKKYDLTPSKTLGLQGFWKLVRLKIRLKTPQMQKKNPHSLAALGIHLEVTPGFEPGNESFADSCLTTWLCHHGVYLYDMRLFEKVNIYFYRKSPQMTVGSSGAGNEARTRYLHLGKVALYRMSYARI